ncbi:MAG: RNA-binding protein [Acidobacteriota bacterium]|jgi:cold-inducible RNA-binding protein|nr:MAG: RNA-binding protein [Acidobacteriota bacterium]
MNRRLFVGNLPFSAEEGTLQDLFSQAGAVDSVRVMRDQATGRSRGFGFVEMATEEGAQAAIDRFNDTELGGRRLAVNEARPPAGGRSFGGGGGNGRGRGGNRREPRW